MTARRNNRPPIDAGDVLRLEEDDYRYGTGAVLFRLTAVVAVFRDDDGPWLHLRGERLREDGTVVEERDLFVRFDVARRRRHPYPERS